VNIEICGDAVIKVDWQGHRHGFAENLWGGGKSLNTTFAGSDNWGRNGLAKRYQSYYVGEGTTVGTEVLSRVFPSRRNCLDCSRIGGRPSRWNTHKEHDNRVFGSGKPS